MDRTKKKKQHGISHTWVNSTYQATFPPPASGPGNVAISVYALCVCVCLYLHCISF